MIKFPNKKKEVQANQEADALKLTPEYEEVQNPEPVELTDEEIEKQNQLIEEGKLPFVRLINVNKIYNKNVHAVFDFNLDIYKREFIAFVGPSGCGKSTTLRMIAGLEDITSGEFYIGTRLANNLPSKDRDIAMVFQNYALYPNMNVYKNMAFSLNVRHYPKAEVNERVMEAAKILELEDYLDRRPKNLSGGQRQRVALGRAIVRNAQLFLMDEPLSNLDAKLRVQMRSEIIKLHKRLNTTTIYVTHDQTEAMTMADRIIVMRAGHVQQIGTPLEIYRHPVNKFVAGFIGAPAMNFVNATYNKGVLEFADGNKVPLDEENIKLHDEFYKNFTAKLDADLARYNEDLAEAKDEKGKAKLEKKIEKVTAKIEEVNNINQGKPHEITFGIRPESIKRVESKTKNSFETVVKLSELLGNEYYVHFDFGGKDVLSKIESEELIKEGDMILLEMKYNKIHLFEKDYGFAINLKKN